jgi:hypothetical protein
MTSSQETQKCYIRFTVDNSETDIRGGNDIQGSTESSFEERITDFCVLWGFSRFIIRKI